MPIITEESTTIDFGPGQRIEIDPHIVSGYIATYTVKFRNGSMWSRFARGRTQDEAHERLYVVLEKGPFVTASFNGKLVL